MLCTPKGYEYPRSRTTAVWLGIGYGVDVPRLFLKLGYLSSAAICDGNSRHCLRLCGCNHRICYGSTKLQSSSFKRWFSSLPYAGQGCRQRWGSGARPPIWNWCPPFHVWPVATYIQYCILKMWPPFWFLAPPGFWPPLLLHPGDEPDAGVCQPYNHCSFSISVQPIVEAIFQLNFATNK